MSKCNQLFMEQQESEEFRRYLAENEPMEFPPDYQAHLDKQPPKDYVEDPEYLKYLEEKTNES